MRKQISYEVYVKDRSGRWEIHAHYSAAQRKVAEEEAHDLEAMPHIRAVKVVREVYDRGSNQADEIVVYQTRETGNQPAAPTASPPGLNVGPGRTSSGQSRHPAQDDAPRKQSDKQKPPRTVTSPSKPQDIGLIGLILRMLIAICASIIVGLAAMIGSAKLLEHLPAMGLSISQGFYDKASFVAFMLGFMVSAVPIMMMTTGRLKNFTWPGNQKNAKSKTKPTPPARRNARTAKPSPGFAPFQPGSSMTDIDTTRRETEKDSDRPSFDSLENRADTAPSEGMPDQPDKSPAAPTAVKAARETMTGFMERSVISLGDSVPSMDAYQKFGVNLYVAGACDACGEDNALPRDGSRTILHDCISALGTTGKMADTFCNSVDQYLEEPKYKDMYQTGHESLKLYMRDSDSVGPSVAKAMADWSEKPAPAQPAAGKALHALMFTDIVNSTQITQQLGDHGAQQMVHTHNQIVRTALLNNYGKEVKHMGDGIMAVFPSSATAVQAGIEIQKNMANHNARGELVFQIRIGINAGEAITEENDLFGTVVQLAARVCGAAKGDEILVSSAVRDTYVGKRAQFTSRGAKEMKGFAEPIEVFAVTER